MSSTRLDNFERAVHSADTWLSDVAARLETEDRKRAYRAMRAWLHALRDRLTVDSAAKFGAQLPELLRGVYYDGWDPSRAPIKYGPQEYVNRFAREANVAEGDVPRVSAAVSAAVDLRMSGQLAETLEQLPHALRGLISGSEDIPAMTSSGQLGSEAADVLTELRGRVETLTEAMRTLATGFEGGPLEEPDGEERRARAARLASEMLMTIGS